MQGLVLGSLVPSATLCSWKVLKVPSLQIMPSRACVPLPCPQAASAGPGHAAHLLLMLLLAADMSSTLPCLLSVALNSHLLCAV